MALKCIIQPVDKNHIKTRRRKSVLLALGFYVHEINVGVAKYARLANWILDDTSSRNGLVPAAFRIAPNLSSGFRGLIDFRSIGFS